MTPERWREVKAVLGEALERPAAERVALVERACGADAALRREVESLLANGGAEGGGDPDGDSLPGLRAAVAATAAALAGGSADDDRVLRPLLERALAPRYDVLRPLGSGGMGAVYLAWERELERFVAVKVLRPDLAATPVNRERFRREARIVAQLAHPGILPLYSFGEVGGVWYFVMGYVRGESLAERLRRGALPCADARRLLAELADALACAHRHGVIHRDIKPANVLLDEESGRAVLTDFGISKVDDGRDVVTGGGAIIGTPRYMSPEQARGSADVDARSDVYSLGAVGYTMLAGHAPFVGGTADEVLLRCATQEPPSLRQVAPSAPEAFAAVVMRCLAADPALRWPDARSLGQALARLADDQAAPAEALRDVSGFGPYALVWAIAWSALAALTARSAGDRGWLLLVALLVPIGLGLHVWNVERQGLTPLQFTRLAFHPPRWWGMWWPRALRRPGDLWARLPWPARLVRRVVSAFFVALPLLLLARPWLTVGDAAGPTRLAAGYGAAAERGLALCAAVVTAGAAAWSFARGLSLREAAQLLFGATVASPAWHAPNVARLLAPASRAVRPPEAASAADHARAIAELAVLLRPDAAEAGADAARAAERIAAAVAASEPEVAALSRDAGAAERDRLTAQLGALDEASPHDDADHRELRALVAHQLALVDRMRARHDSLVLRRTRLVDVVRGLWAQLDAVHGAAAEPAARAEAVARLRALCAEAADLLRAGPPRR